MDLHNDLKSLITEDGVVESNSIMYIDTKIVESIQITITREKAKQTLLLSTGDGVKVKYVDDNEMRTIEGRLYKFNRESLFIDCSRAYNSITYIVNIESIREIEQAYPTELI